MMLNRQYGIAAPSSVVKVVHPEDSQPNEKIHGRSRNLPPRVANTARPPRFDRIVSNSGERLSQFATRGSWKGRGRGRTNISRQEPHPDNYARGSKTVYGHPSSGSLSSRTFAEGNSHISNDVRLPFPNSFVLPQSTSAGPDAQATHSPVLLWHYRSPSPKLPPEPIRRRAPLDGQTKAPSFIPSGLLPVPLPGRKRNAVDALPSEPSPPKKLKCDLREQPVTPSPTSNRPCNDVLVIKGESPPPDPIPPLRKPIKEACSFWRIPDNCRKSDPHHQNNRKAFAREKIKELSKLNLKRTKVFFREDGLVVEWKSDVPVWNDTLLPERPLSQYATKSPSAGSSSKPNSSKRKRAISEINNLDALPTPIPDKKPRSSNLANVGSSASNEQSEADQSQPQTQPRQSSATTPSPKKGKLKDKLAKHWAAGLSKEDIQKLGKGVQVPSSDSKPLPHPSSSNSNPNTSAILPVRSSFDRAYEDVGPSSTRRPALPTRIARTATTATPNPEQERECPTVNSAFPSVIQSEELKIPEDVQLLASAFNDHDDIYVDDEPSLTAQLYTESGGKEDVTMFAKEESASRKCDDTTEEFVFELSFNDGAAPQLCEMQGMHSMAENPRVVDMIEIECDEKRDEGFDAAKQEDCVAVEAVIQDQLQFVEDINSSGAEQDHVMDSPEYEIAVEFLQRFIELFDTDRTQLQMAYSEDAQFSYRVHNTQSPSASFAGLFAPESAAAMIHQGRSAIIDRLCAFGNYQFSQKGVPSKMVYYDLASLPREIIGAVGVSPVDDGAAILATLHSEVINLNSEDPNSNHVLTLDQSFLLRRRTDWGGDNAGDSLGISGSRSEWVWPFLIVSHQMVIRDGPLLPADNLDKVLWIKGIDFS